jgi:hypothetical protein
MSGAARPPLRMVRPPYRYRNYGAGAAASKAPGAGGAGVAGRLGTWSCTKMTLRLGLLALAGGIVVVNLSLGSHVLTALDARELHTSASRLLRPGSDGGLAAGAGAIDDANCAAARLRRRATQAGRCGSDCAARGGTRAGCGRAAGARGPRHPPPAPAGRRRRCSIGSGTSRGQTQRGAQPAAAAARVCRAPAGAGGARGG